MIIYRALNEYDKRIKPLEYGLFSRKNIVDAVWSMYDFWNYTTGVSEEEYKNNLLEYIQISSTMSELFDLSINKDNNVNELKNKLMDAYNNDDHELIEEYGEKIMSIISTFNSQIISGNRTNTDWISFTSSIKSLMPFYMSQNDTHYVVAMDSNINQVYDGDRLVVDISDDEAIRKNNFLFKKNNGDKPFEYMSLNSRSITYAKKSKELVYYNHISADKLIEIKPLHIDMLYNGILSDRIFKLDRNAIMYKLHVLDAFLGIQVLKTNDEFLEKVYKELYRDKKTISSLTEYNKDELIEAKEDILNLLNNIEKDDYFCKNRIKQKVYAPERDY